MEFHLSNEDFKIILNICRSNKTEISGKMYFTKDGIKYCFKRWQQDEESLIVTQTKARINFNLQRLLEDMVWRVSYSDDDIYVIFHTHPGFLGAVGLSDADREILKDLQEIANQTKKPNLSSSAIQIVSGIVSRDKVGFFFYDPILKRYGRFKTFVNGKEILPDFEADGSRNRITTNNQERDR